MHGYGVPDSVVCPVRINEEQMKVAIKLVEQLPGLQAYQVCPGVHLSGAV